MFLPGIGPDELMGYFFGGAEPMAGAPIKQSRRKWTAPKRALDSRPSEVYAVVYENGRCSLVSEQHWQKLRRQASEDKMLRGDYNIKRKPRFFLGKIEWWQYFDATEGE